MIGFDSTKPEATELLVIRMNWLLGTNRRLTGFLHLVKQTYIFRKSHKLVCGFRSAKTVACEEVINSELTDETPIRAKHASMST